MERRTFVRRLPVMGATLAAASGVLSGCAGAPYLAPTVTPGALSIDPAALGPDGDAFLQMPGAERPIYLRRLPDGEWTAVLASCTHRGCQPEPVADRLACPCHGSEFSFTGTVLNGPADEPLTRFRVVEREGRILVLLDEEGA